MTGRSSAPEVSEERFEWLQIVQPDDAEPAAAPAPGGEAVLGKRCPDCGWLGPETDAECFRCGYQFTAETRFADLIQRLGVQLPPRILEKPDPAALRSMLRSSPSADSS